MPVILSHRIEISTQDGASIVVIDGHPISGVIEWRDYRVVNGKQRITLEIETDEVKLYGQ